MYSRLFLLLTAYFLWHLSQQFLSTDVKTEFLIVDRLHDSSFFTMINEYLANNSFIAAANFILTSLLIDMNVLYIAYRYLKTNNFKKTMFILFGGFMCRQLCQYINRLPVPNNMVWFDPGFPAFLVTYVVENDFFFSGHTYVALSVGIAIVSGSKNIFVKMYGIFFILYEILFIISIRAHYFMDIYGAIATYFMLAYFYDKMVEHKIISNN